MEDADISADRTGRVRQGSKIRPGAERRERGFATLLVLLLLTSLSLYGAEGYLKANGQNRIARREAQSRQAFYAAEGGIEWAKSELVVNPGWKNGELSLAGGKVKIEAELSSELSEGGYVVTSTAQVGLASRKLSVHLKRSAGRWLTLRYQEMHQ